MSSKAQGNEKYNIILSSPEKKKLNNSRQISNLLSSSPQSSSDWESPPVARIVNISNGTSLNLKIFYYLVATMNNMFPDYDFR